MNHMIWTILYGAYYMNIASIRRKQPKHTSNNLYDTHNRLEHRRNSRRSFRNRNFKQQVPS